MSTVVTRKLTDLGATASNAAFKFAVQVLEGNKYVWKQKDSSELDLNGVVGQFKEVAIDDVSSLVRWLPADGRALNVADYPDLFARIGNRFGGDGITTFNLPEVSDAIEVDTDTQVLVFWKEHAVSATRGITVSDPKRNYTNVAIIIPDIRLIPGNVHEFSGLVGELSFLNVN